MDEQVDLIFEYRFDVCPCCGGSLSDQTETTKMLHSVEIINQPIEVTEHRRVGQSCRDCGSKVLLETLGEEFDGTIGCDYFSAYHKFMRLDANVKLQFCIAHLIRDIKFLCEHPDPANQSYGRQLREHFRKLFKTIARRDEFTSEATFRRSLTRIRDEIVWDACVGQPDTQHAANMAERFYTHFEDYFRFISDPNIGPTNNLAEQAIRFVAIHRRMTQGTRGIAGQSWFERICTVVVTCEQQSKSVFEFLVGSVASYLRGESAPSLLPVGSDSS